MTPEDSWKALGDFIKAQRQLADLSVRQLADMAKVSNPYLSQIERGLHKPSAQVLKNLADALHVSAEVFYEQAGFLDKDTEKPGSSVEEAIRLDPKLTTDQKDALMRVYQGFVAANG
ncbi:MAG TPA: helix-turn-helix transcriptional regulator [Chloroflexota bacterium]|nr:helix-turn-helix transcriptional regulator [Chloroflexota bacterium]